VQDALEAEFFEGRYLDAPRADQLTLRVAAGLGGERFETQSSPRTSAAANANATPAPRRSLGMSVHAGVIPGRGGSAPRIGADSYRPPNASAIRTASSFLTSASGRGWSTGKCSDPLVDV
jgi:hypothetical protein